MMTTADLVAQQMQTNGEPYTRTGNCLETVCRANHACTLILPEGVTRYQFRDGSAIVEGSTWWDLARFGVPSCICPEGDGNDDDHDPGCPHHRPEEPEETPW